MFHVYFLVKPFVGKRLIAWVTAFWGFPAMMIRYILFLFQDSSFGMPRVWVLPLTWLYF